MRVLKDIRYSVCDECGVQYPILTDVQSEHACPRCVLQRAIETRGYENDDRKA